MLQARYQPRNRFFPNDLATLGLMNTFTNLWVPRGNLFYSRRDRPGAPMPDVEYLDEDALHLFLSDHGRAVDRGMKMSLAIRGINGGGRGKKGDVSDNNQASTVRVARLINMKKIEQIRTHTGDVLG